MLSEQDQRPRCPQEKLQHVFITRILIKVFDHLFEDQKTQFVYFRDE